MDPPFLMITLSILILALSPLHVISLQPLPPRQQPHQKPTLTKPGGRTTSPSASNPHHHKVLPVPSSLHKHHPVLPAPHSMGQGLIKAAPQAKPAAGKRPQESKANAGKKVGMLLLGIAASLQVAMVGILGFSMWQISKIKDGEFA